MTEPEPFEGWRALRDRVLVYLREGDRASSATSFLDDCPAIDGHYDAAASDMRLVFLCSRPYLEEMEECPELYDELTGALQAVVRPSLSNVWIATQYGTPDELSAFRTPDRARTQLSAAEST